MGDCNSSDITMCAVCWISIALFTAGSDAQSLRGISPDNNSDFTFRGAERVVNSSDASTLFTLTSTNATLGETHINETISKTSPNDILNETRIAQLNNSSSTYSTSEEEYMRAA